MKDASTILFDADNPYQIDLSNYTIQDIKTNSRQVEKNDLFVAIKGHTVDGHSYIPQAIENGAHLILANATMQDFFNTPGFSHMPILYVENTADYLSVIMNRFLDSPSQRLNVFGITGTNGKTTTATILNHILNENKQKSGFIGTTGAHGSNYTIETENTTPDPLILQNIFNDMVSLGMKNAVMEVSSIGLSENRTAETDFSVAIFTNLTHDHLNFHGSMENYMHAKSKLFSQLNKKNSRGEINYAVINEDEETSPYFKAQTNASVVTYGIENPADYQAIDIHYSITSTLFTLLYKGKSYLVETPLVGENNVYNILAAVAGAHVKSLGLEEILPALKTVQSVSGRLEILTLPEEDDITVVVDYAHTPTSLEKTLNILRQLDHPNIISVFGCNGDRDVQKRPLMAQIGVDNSSLAVFTTGNPRTEDQNKIFEDMKRGLRGNNYLQIADRSEAIEYAIQHANKDDLVLIAGKGHEDYQIIGTKKYHFDDHEVALEALKNRKNINSY